MKYEDVKITKFEGGIKNASHPKFITIDTALEEIETGKYKSFIEFLRKFRDSDQPEDIKAYGEEKGKLDYYCFMCRCTYRNSKNVTKNDVTPFFIADIDNIDALHLDILKEELRNDPHVYACFISPSGEGLKVLYVYDNEKHNIIDVFYAVYDHIKKNYGVTIDRSGKDIVRACYTSYDKEIYINEKATPIPCRRIKVSDEDNTVGTVPKAAPIPLERLLKCVVHIVNNNIRIVEEHEDWIYIGLIIASNYGEDGREAFLKISQIYSNVKNSKRNPDKKYSYLIKTFRKQLDVSWIFSKAGFDGHDTKTYKHHLVAEYIRKKGIYYNEVTNRMEWQEGKEFSSFDANTVYLGLMPAGIEKVPRVFFDTVLMSNFIDSKHPPLDLFNDFVEDYSDADLDAFKRFFDHFTFDIKPSDPDHIEAYYIAFIKRWLFQFPAVLHGRVPELCLVLIGPQGNGKTELFNRILIPEMQIYYSTDKLDKGTKDDDIALAENWCILDDEFSGKSKKESSHWKSVLSKRVVKCRKPYARNPETMQRLAVFCGTSNDSDVIYDRTGNRRILPIPMRSRDFDLFDDIDKYALWRCVFALWDQDRRSHKLTDKELDCLHHISDIYTVVDVEKELVLKHFESADLAEYNGEWYTASDIAEYITKDNKLRVNPYAIGRVCQQLGWEKVFIPGSKGRRGYYIKEIKGTITTFGN